MNDLTSGYTHSLASILTSRSVQFNKRLASVWDLRSGLVTWYQQRQSFAAFTSAFSPAIYSHSSWRHLPIHVLLCLTSQASFTDVLKSSIWSKPVQSGSKRSISSVKRSTLWCWRIRVYPMRCTRLYHFKTLIPRNRASLTWHYSTLVWTKEMRRSASSLTVSELSLFCWRSSLNLRSTVQPTAMRNVCKTSCSVSRCRSFAAVSLSFAMLCKTTMRDWRSWAFAMRLELLLNVLSPHD